MRDQLSISCRRYQAARQREKDTQVCLKNECISVSEMPGVSLSIFASQVSDVSVSDLCVEALCWACRLLPFCHFLNAEEVLQDLVLSLVSELLPSRVVIYITNLNLHSFRILMVCMLKQSIFFCKLKSKGY